MTMLHLGNLNFLTLAYLKYKNLGKYFLNIMERDD